MDLTVRSLGFLFFIVVKHMLPLMCSQNSIWCMLCFPLCCLFMSSPPSPEVMILKLSSLILACGADKRIIKQKDLLGCGNNELMSASWILHIQCMNGCSLSAILHIHSKGAVICLWYHNGILWEVSTGCQICMECSKWLWCAIHSSDGNQINIHFLVDACLGHFKLSTLTQSDRGWISRWTVCYRTKVPFKSSMFTICRMWVFTVASEAECELALSSAPHEGPRDHTKSWLLVSADPGMHTPQSVTKADNVPWVLTSSHIAVLRSKSYFYCDWLWMKLEPDGRKLEINAAGVHVRAEPFDAMGWNSGDVNACTT